MQSAAFWLPGGALSMECAPDLRVRVRGLSDLKSAPCAAKNVLVRRPRVRSFAFLSGFT